MAKLARVNRLIQIKKRVLDPDSCVQVGSQFVANATYSDFKSVSLNPIYSISIYLCTKC